jgi:hypothetical protein
MLFTLILAVAIGAFVLSRPAAPAQPDQPSQLTLPGALSRIAVDQVDPALAVAALGGVSELDIIGEALQKNRPETALAALLFQPGLPDKESAGSFLALAGLYATAKQPEKSVFSYQMAGTIATLSPNIPDIVRADLYTQVSEGLIKLEQPLLAKFYLDQAFTLAENSPFLQAASRRAIFEMLQKNYIILGERESARRSLDLSANPPRIVSILEEETILPPIQPALLSTAVQAAEAQRWQKAQELAALLVQRGGHAPPSAVEALREALVAEDAQKLPFYENELQGTTRLSQKIDLTMAQIEWLSIKYRVAKRAYGLSLVPEWEGQAEEIRAALTKAYENLFAFYADLIIALPDATEIDKATEESLRREILAGELGRYPNYPQEQRRKQLLDITQQLMTTRPEFNLFVSTDSLAGQETYTLIPIGD